MSFTQPANPSFGNGQVVNAGTSTTAFTLTAKSKQIIATNLGTNPVYVRLTPAGGSATTADMVVPANQQVTFTKDYDTLAGAAIAPAGATNIHLMPAEGLATN